MVFISHCLRSEKKVRRYLKGFIDSLRLTVKGGTGGNGLPKYGGVGGQGGNVYCIAKENITLKKVKDKWSTQRVLAGHGGNSHSKAILGESGIDADIEVPLGIRVYRDDGKLLADLNEDGAKALVARGGYGGSHRSGWLGIKGQSNIIGLDLRLIADIGLVGFPNAGKSTLLKAVSRAKPKIASYPFTTIKPNIGIMEYPNLRSISMADLPGLIEGAHANIGMGHKFLKHVERTKMLLLIVDINGFQLSPKHKFRSCLENIILLNKELELYKKELLEKPATLIINKMDTPDATMKYDEIKDKISHLSEILKDFPEEMCPETPLIFDDIIPISAKSGGEKQIQYVKERLKDILDLNDEISKKKDMEENARLIHTLKEEISEKAEGSQQFHR